MFYILYFQHISQSGYKYSGLIQLTFFPLFPKIQFRENCNLPSEYIGFAENGQREVKIISSSLFHFNAETFILLKLKKKNWNANNITTIHIFLSFNDTDPE